MDAKHDLRKRLEELGLSEKEAAVYVALTELGEAKAAVVAKKSGLKRTTVVGILGGLRERGFVSDHTHRGVTRFLIESPRLIEEELRHKLTAAEGLQTLLSDLYRAEADFPVARVFDTKAAIKRMIDRTVNEMERGGSIRTIDNPHAGNYDKILTKEQKTAFIALKARRRIRTRTLVPAGTFALIAPEKLAAQAITIRELPAAIDFRSSLWLVGDMVVLFSGRYPFAVGIHHRFIAGSVGSLWEYLWSVGNVKN